MTDGDMDWPPGCIICRKDCPPCDKPGYRNMYCSVECTRVNWPEYNEQTKERGRSWWELEKEKEKEKDSMTYPVRYVCAWRQGWNADIELYVRAGGHYPAPDKWEDFKVVDLFEARSDGSRKQLLTLHTSDVWSTSRGGPLLYMQGAAYINFDVLETVLKYVKAGFSSEELHFAAK